jgi:L-malate glycosyltransferase
VPREEGAVGGRTVLVLPAWYPTQTQGLAGPFVRDHARAAAMFGHDMVVFADDGSRADVRGLFEFVTEQDGAVTVVRFAAKPGWRRFVYGPAVLLLARRLAGAGRSVSVLHAHVHWMGWAAVPLGFVLRRPVVISEHSTEWPGRTMKKGALRLARFTFSRAALVCPVSEALQRAIEAYGLRARFRVVSNPVDTSVFYPGESLPSDQPTRLVNVALHGENKGLDILLRAMKLLITRRRTLTLDLVGEGPLTPELQRLTAELQLEDHVRFLGPMDSAGVANVLRESHVFVLSSLVETQGVAVIEALCCGLAVAATRAPGVPEVVGDGDESVLAQPNDPDALAAAIETVLDRYPKLDRAGSARRAAERFSLEAVGRVWDEIYRSL